MLYIQEKIARFLPLQGAEVRSRTGRYFLNFRCPICLDSAKSSRLKRGWFQRKDNDLRFVCYNCHKNELFTSFLKYYYPDHYNDYLKELFIDRSPSNIEKKPEFKLKKDAKLDLFATKHAELDLQKVNELPEEHAAACYLRSRLIESDVWSDIYYTDNFGAWAHDKEPELFQNIPKSDRRIIFPLRNREGDIFGVSARSIIPGIIPKYYTVKFDKEADKIFGLNRIDYDKKVYVLEGPIDSYYVDNAIAMVGAASGLDKLLEYITIDNIIIIGDNERRNRHTINYMQKAIDTGFKIVIWPIDFKYKDINESIVDGMTRHEIMKVIRENTFSGMTAQLKLNFYKKV